MKKFILKSLLLLLAATLITNIIAFWCLFNVKNKYALLSHERNAILSYERLTELSDTNKIVIIAGSNGSFGFNSKMLADTFLMPVINTSTHAGMGIRMQFELYKELLRNGDIVIFCPEYGGDANRLYGSATLLRILSTNTPFGYHDISIKQMLHLYKYIGEFCTECYNAHNLTKIDRDPYSVEALNMYGDIDIERTHEEIKPFNEEQLINDDIISYIKYVQSYLYKNGIKFIYLPPTFMQSNFIAYKEKINHVVMLLKANGIAYQSEPETYAFPDTLYYDSPYHLTKEGANMRTQLVIKDLQRFLSTH